jgi:hypothetical protein
LSLIESLVLSAIRGAIGLLPAHWLVRAIVALAPPDIPRIDEVNLDRRVLVSMLAIVILASR